MTSVVILAMLLSTATSALGVAYVRCRRALRGVQRELATMQQQRAEEHRQLRERSALDALKDEFISTVSHELRTPLTSIRGSLGLLSSGVLGAVDPKARNLLRIAVSNTDRLIRLINDILDLERMQSGRAPLELRRCSLQELAEIAIESMVPVADTAEIQLRLHTGSAEGLFLDGDPDRIVQVLTNLLSNAIKFSPAQSVVHVHAEATIDSILLRVVDQGRGIPSDKLDAIFDRFLQIEHGDARQKGGSGLGLAICRTIIHQHSGSIWAQQNAGAGSSFHILLPRTARSSDAIALPPPASPVGDGCVLVCDDEAAIRTIVCEHLTRQGYRCLEAGSGEEALELAANQPVEAILLDLYMPGLSGWETLQRLRESAATSHIPVVVLSVLSPELRREMAGDAQGWIQKPFNEHLLFAELARVLRPETGPVQVLLVEDDEDLASVVMSSFADTEVNVTHARTRQQAIRHCLTHRPDLLILDLTLPDGNGFSFVEWVRHQPGLATLPLVVYSGHDVSDRERSALRLGPTEFLTKARVQPQDVEALVLSMTRRYRRSSTSMPATVAS